MDTLYESILSNRYNLDSYEEADDCDAFTIPVNLLAEEKMPNKFMENIKTLIRGSLEYKQWTKWFKQQYNPVMCSVSDNTQTIEIHHHPFTLEDYVDIALSYLYNNHVMYTTMLIADLVMRWHYMNIVGACYMCKTYHMRFHEDHDVIIPEECIYGNMEAFLKDPIISQYVNSYLLDKLSNYCPQFCKEHNDLLTI